MWSFILVTEHQCVGGNDYFIALMHMPFNTERVDTARAAIETVSYLQFILPQVSCGEQCTFVEIDE